jgi:hypothetical protein
MAKKATSSTKKRTSSSDASRETTGKAKAAPASTALATPAQATPRRVKVPTYKSFRLEKRVKRTSPDRPVPGAFRLLRNAAALMWRNKRAFVGIAIVYALLSLALVGGFSVANLKDAKQSFGDVFNGQVGQLATGLSLFVYLLGNNSANSTPTASVYEVILAIIASLAAIWAIRQMYAGNKVRIRDPFYLGMSPLIPFILVLGVIGIQLLPAAVGAFLYSTVVTNGIAATAIEQAVVMIVFALLCLTSLYMLCSSLFALYIVSLPEVAPMAALRSARQLVLHRRWMVLRKVLFLPLALVVITGLIITPFIILLTPAAPWMFIALSALIVPFVHAYLYGLYRALL